ncbi:hypothetical protein LK542_05295 [Massilia sp. IC2-477]|uniref:hypothetical protein n=1 Tax=Massilia sp. IC2-477 TaxID=2887198 RepID=UPI001D110A78|nr:hypothetical protein [Massilia sp. IC2-477]MCC2955032.1 hypothetical protein [Massilia sp. IC2-477]
MKFLTHPLTKRAAYTVLFGATLTACGSGGSTTDQNNVLSSSMDGTRSMSLGTYVPQSRGTTTGTNTNTGATNPAGTITTVRFEGTSSAAQTNVPVTFGQVFVAGDLPANSGLVGRLEDGSSLPLQVDVKAKHADGSVRHAIISTVLPTLNVSEVRSMSLIRGTAAAATPAAITAPLDAGFTASVSATLNGVRYSASADQLMRSGKAKVWLTGGAANEWHVMAPLTTSSGIQHPYLTARFAIRWYPTVKKARVDTVVENTWAFEANPNNYTYNAEVVVGGKTVYSNPSMTHYHHARWRQLAWWGSATPEVNVKHNTGYLIATKAVPNYDQAISVPEASLNALKAEWTGAITQPMATGLAIPSMPTTGGRRDIGLLPSWTVMYLLSMDKRAREVTLGTADLSGSWSSHIRDKQTDLPVSVNDYPYMSVLGRGSDTFNWKLARDEKFPACAVAGGCGVPNDHDTSHQPNLAYVPYLVTGDYYYLEELQFWGMYSTLVDNPYYRGFEKGIVSPDQVRGQAWSLRTLAEAAYITPDSHPLKSQFLGFIDNNLDWYNNTYTTGAATSNALGVITNGYAIVYEDGTGLAPWQDDFFTSAVGHAAELGFVKAETLLRWKVKFPIARMVGQGACWIGAANYSMKVRDSYTSPIYSTIAQVYKKSSPDYTSTACASDAMAKVLGLRVGEMFGYAPEATGYPANMQPALAYAASYGGTEGQKAWALFEQRNFKPNYAYAPQFAIKPR